MIALRKSGNFYNPKKNAMSGRELRKKPIRLKKRKEQASKLKKRRSPLLKLFVLLFRKEKK